MQIFHCLLYTVLEDSVLCFKKWFSSRNLFIVACLTSLVIKAALFALRRFCFIRVYSCDADEWILLKVWNSILFMSNFINLFFNLVVNDLLSKCLIVPIKNCTNPKRTPIPIITRNRGVITPYSRAPILITSWSYHCVKSVQIRSFFWSVFSCIRTGYRKIRARKNSAFGHFSRSVWRWDTNLADEL